MWHVNVPWMVMKVVSMAVFGCKDDEGRIDVCFLLPWSRYVESDNSLWTGVGGGLSGTSQVRRRARVEVGGVGSHRRSSRHTVEQCGRGWDAQRGSKRRRESQEASRAGARGE